MTRPRSPGRQVSKLGFGPGQPHSGKHRFESVLLGIPCPSSGSPGGSSGCRDVPFSGLSRTLLPWLYVIAAFVLHLWPAPAPWDLMFYNYRFRTTAKGCEAPTLLNSKYFETHLRFIGC